MARELLACRLWIVPAAFSFHHKFWVFYTPWKTRSVSKAADNSLLCADMDAQWIDNSKLGAVRTGCVFKIVPTGRTAHARSVKTVWNLNLSTILSLTLSLTLKKETKERNLEKGKKRRTFRIRKPTVPRATTQPTVLNGNSLQTT